MADRVIKHAPAPPRGWLFVPGDRAPERLAKAVASGADVVIVDLEDGVAPPDRPAARTGLRAALAAVTSPIPVYVRVNALDEPDAGLDLEAIADLPFDGIVLPKCEDAGVVGRLRRAWPRPAAPPASIVVLLETPAGVLAAPAIARADPAIVAVALGAEDLAVRTGIRRTPEGIEILTARSLVVLAAAAAGVWSLDTPSLELADPAAVERDARVAAGLGFSGKLLVHPRQVAPVRAAFRPTAGELERARAIVAAADVRGDRGDGAVAADGRMIDRPVVDAARRLLADGEPDVEDDAS
jgi:citrate lyase subunit beta / citryl-CoA lyase